MTRLLGDDWMLPGLDERNHDWFTSGELKLRECTACRTLQFPPEDVCSGCQGSEFGLRASAGRGRIESVAVVHHPVHPALKDAVPYALVVVSLDDAPGVHLIGNVLGRAPDQIEIGQNVRLVFEEIEDPDGDEPLRIPQWNVIG